MINNPQDKITIQKGDLLEIENLKDNSKKYFVFNGGGSISGGNNKLELKSINIKDTSRLFLTLNEFALTKPIKINFFGEISYEEFKKN